MEREEIWISTYIGLDSSTKLLKTLLTKNKKNITCKVPFSMNAYGQSWNYQSYKHETNSNNKPSTRKTEKHSKNDKTARWAGDFSDQGITLTCV